MASIMASFLRLLFASLTAVNLAFSSYTLSDALQSCHTRLAQWSQSHFHIWERWHYLLHLVDFPPDPRWLKVYGYPDWEIFSTLSQVGVIECSMCRKEINILRPPLKCWRSEPWVLDYQGPFIPLSWCFWFFCLRPLVRLDNIPTSLIHCY